MRKAKAKKRPLPDLTKQQLERFIKKTTLKIPMELVLEFDQPVSVAEGRQITRRLMEALQLNAEAFHPPVGFAEASLKSMRSARVLKIRTGEPLDPQDQP